ncbi:MAG TPA: polyphosphate kinase 2 family protein [Bacteroidetes bacterium]|nr:polyphosphate kinase 2 family protein [Bacteroidota bacterium]
MNLKIDLQDFYFDPQNSTSVSSLPNEVTPLYKKKSDYRDLLEKNTAEIHDLQNLMYAHDRYALLLIFQGMDSAGKDGAIRHVMTGINPAGVQVFSFKKPSKEELDHDWMWRTSCSLPERGRIGIFNRSYYEEVLVVKVHPEIVQKYQRVPKEFIKNEASLWEERYADIRNFENMLHRNGTRIVKFFINISKDEQKERLLARIDQPEKNWKMSPADVKERGYWDDYMQAYEDLLKNTSRENAPWYVIPGNDKKNARLIISQIVLQHLQEMDMNYPVVTDEFRAKLTEVRKVLEDS